MRKTFVLALVLALFTLAFPASAQDSNVIANGLNGPRGLYYDDAGVLWITEAGTTGTDKAQGDLAVVPFGGSARVFKVDAGKAGATLVLGGLPSAQDFDDVIGVNSVYVDANGIWLVTGIGPVADPLVEGVIQLDPKTLRMKQFLDLNNFETTNNPDKDVVMSDPVDIAVGNDGTTYIADASGNDLLTWTAKDGLKLFHVWLDLPVPTSVDVGPDGSIYVGFLSPYPYDSGSARIEKWSPDGKLLKTYSGLTAVTDVLVDANTGTLYAVEFSNGYGDAGWTANSGSVVTVADDGTTKPVAENLNFPYRLAESPDGSLAVTVNSAFSAPGSGEVILISGDIPTLSKQQLLPPVSTSEANATSEAAGQTPEAPVATPEASS